MKAYKLLCRQDNKLYSLFKGRTTDEFAIEYKDITYPKFGKLFAFQKPEDADSETSVDNNRRIEVELWEVETGEYCLYPFHSLPCIVLIDFGVSAENIEECKRFWKNFKEVKQDDTYNVILTDSIKLIQRVL